jgi:soluble lytic murein transglycosylase-like protein
MMLSRPRLASLFRLAVTAAALSFLSACGLFRGDGGDVSRGPYNPPLYPNETPALREDINNAAEYHDIPAELIHRVILRESDHRPEARNGPYYGLMQVLPATASTMGFDGHPSELLDPEVNLRYAGAYLRGAYIVADGDMDEAIQWYASGYYYEARNRCLLVETGLRDSEVRC